MGDEDSVGPDPAGINHPLFDQGQDDDDDYDHHPFIQGYHDEDSDDYDHDPTGINRPFIGTLDSGDDCSDHGGINLFRVMRVRTEDSHDGDQYLRESNRIVAVGESRVCLDPGGSVVRALDIPLLIISMPKDTFHKRVRSVSLRS